MKTMTKPAVAYIRAIATHSKEHQQWFLEKQVSGSEFHIMATFCDTASGTSDTSLRPGLQQLFQALQADPSIHDVIVYDKSRLSRRISEAHQVVKRLMDMGVAVHYGVDGLGSSEVEAIMARCLQMEERRLHGERIRSGLQAKHDVI